MGLMGLMVNSALLQPEAPRPVVFNPFTFTSPFKNLKKLAGPSLGLKQQSEAP
jgi:hypothetical protein